VELNRRRIGEGIMLDNEGLLDIHIQAIIVKFSPSCLTKCHATQTYRLLNYNHDMKTYGGVEL
jgi:hypothetical protein